MSTSEADAKRLKGSKLLFGWALLGGVIAVSIVFGFMMPRLLFGGRPETVQPTPGGIEAIIGPLIIFFILGNLALVAGIIGYILVYVTDCFILDFRQPFWNKFSNVNFRFANIVVPLLIMLGIGGWVCIFVAPVLAIFGASKNVALLVPFFGTLVTLQFITAWVLIWDPVIYKMIKKRLLALGVTEEQFSQGMVVGISNPEQTSFRLKGSFVEEDVGMMWINNDDICYTGDTQEILIPKSGVTRIERAVDKGSIAAYAGAVNVIIHWKVAEGDEQNLRIHPNEKYWTLGRLVKAQDQLAEQLTEWKDSA